MGDKALIRKAKAISGRTLLFRNATVSDAGFIHALRMDERKSRFINKVPPDVDAQKRWLENYATVIDQAYFVIEYKEIPIGTVRFYDQKENSFCWGSWILAPDSPTHAAMESALMVYAYALDHLGFSRAHFEVRRGNESVWKFHERFGAVRVKESEFDYFYVLESSEIKSSMHRYAKYLPFGVKVEY